MNELVLRQAAPCRCLEPLPFAYRRPDGTGKRVVVCSACGRERAGSTSPITLEDALVVSCGAPTRRSSPTQAGRRSWRRGRQLFSARMVAS